MTPARLEGQICHTCLEGQSCKPALHSRGVKSFYGNLSKLGVIDVATTGAIVCTIEKANILVNKLLEEGTLHDILSTVIVDELHMVTVFCKSRAGRFLLPELY